MKTKAVTEATNELWARLASAAAKEALKAVEIRGSAIEAEKWAGVTERWLERAGARATHWKFKLP